MNDELEELTDAGLSKVFAVEVAGFIRKGVLMHKKDGCWMLNPPDFATDANTVLPWLEKRFSIANYYPKGICGVTWMVCIMKIPVISKQTLGEATQKTFPRAACIALIRAKRAEKQQQQPKGDGQ